MPEEVRYMLNSRTIHIKSSGDITIQDLQHSLTRINQLREEYNISKVLVDHSDTTGFPSQIEAFNFGADVAMQLFGMSIALIIPSTPLDNLEFFKEVANIRGGDVRVFQSPEEATRWLANK